MNNEPIYANERIVDEVSQELGLTKAQVTEIVSAQFEYVTYVMRMNTLYGVILPYLGKIKVKVERIFGLHHRRAENHIKVNTSTPKQ